MRFFFCPFFEKNPWLNFYKVFRTSFRHIFGQFENLLVLSDIMPPLEMSHTRCLHNKFFQIYSWQHLKIAIMDSTDLRIFVETEDQWFWVFEWNYQYDTLALKQICYNLMIFYQGAIFILRKCVLRFFWTTHPPT